MNQFKHHNIKPLFQPSLGMKLCILGACFFIMIFVTGLATTILSNLIADKRNLFLLSSILQSFLAFILPAWMVARLCYKNPSDYLQLSSPTSLRQYAGVVALLALITPFMNMIIEWNANFTFPAGMSEFEVLLRGWEDAAADTTQLILGDTSLWGLISGIIVVGCITGFAEEIFFRAGIQKALTSSGWNVHVSVWLAAFIFSACHFQFFGFFPRMILGAVFGYLFLFTGSLKISAFAHAFNNSIVVVSAWVNARGYSDMDFDKQTFSPWVTAFSLLLAVIFIVYFGKSVFTKKN